MYGGKQLKSNSLMFAGLISQGIFSSRSEALSNTDVFLRVLNGEKERKRKHDILCSCIECTPPAPTIDDIRALDSYLELQRKATKEANITT